MRVELTFDRYILYHELESYLREAEDRYPNLCSLSEAGKSYEGRSIWVLTLTNKVTGKDLEKPGIYVGGNIHAGEVTGSMVALYLVDYLLKNYGKEEDATHLLDTKTFYVLPRVNPDGAELYLTTPTMLRSSVRLWPFDDLGDLPGLHRDDVDGNGKILQMRLRDNHKGEWKVSSKDPRLLVPRRPGERKGPFYRLYPEGYIKDYEGEPFPVNRSKYGLDLNRNFPSNWDPKIPGGGDYPTSEPEVRAIVDFIVKHPNIGALQELHTHGGFYYRNPYQYPEDKMDQDDLRATREIAREGTKVSGYPDVKSSNRATLTEWGYEHKGIIGYTTELWDLYARAGIDLLEHQKAQDAEKREEISLKLLNWNDRNLSGKGFYDWKPFEHPQLGPLEIGGWDTKFCVQNPPPGLLLSECHKNALWIMKHASALPEVDITRVTVEIIDANTRKVTACIENFGYLPTSITNKAKDVGAVRKDQVEIVLGQGASVVGSPKEEVDFLEGYLNGQKERPARSSLRVHWVVKLDGGKEQDEGDLGKAPQCAVVYKSQRGGTREKPFDLK